ncbi:MAG TPA: lamin tail domain-containing protein [Fibrobacteria bacterium]|nr:lamin tail domain-containing protein [Fibrobacteria bacterium]
MALSSPRRQPRVFPASRLLPALVAWLPPFLIAGCLVSVKDGKTSRDANADGLAGARLMLRTAALAGGSSPAARIDSIAVQVTGEGMESMDFPFAGDTLELDLSGLPPGPGRHITASLFRKGRLLYRGETVAELNKEKRVEVALRCEPKFSRVAARLHLPASLPVTVADGWLVLVGEAGEFKARLETRGEFGTFLVDEVPGDSRYQVTLTLLDGIGKPVYESRRTGLLLSLGTEANWDLPLTPTQAMAGLVLDLSSPRQTTAGARFPASLRRPQRAREVVLTEFYAAPSTEDSTAEGEWWEIFNRSADSLLLSGCRLTRTRGGGATQSFAFDTTHRIAPGQALTFGRSASPATRHYADFTLVNTVSPLMLLCAGDSLVVDSLRYSANASDSLAVTIREGWVSSLDVDSLGSAGRGAWCLTRMPGSGGTATPGSLGDCF